MATFVSDFGQGVLTLSGTDYICQVTSARMFSRADRQDIKTACGTTTRFINRRFDVVIDHLQDWRSGGISTFLWDHFNVDVAFTFCPDPDGTPLFSGTLTCADPNPGGAAGEPMTDSVVLPVVGIPTKTADV